MDVFVIALRRTLFCLLAVEVDDRFLISVRRLKSAANKIQFSKEPKQFQQRLRYKWEDIQILSFIA